MASRSEAEAGLAPVLTVLSLLASGGILAGGFYLANTFYEERTQSPPEVGVWADDAHDRILVVTGDVDADWHGLELKTDRPARATLAGEATLTQGTHSPGSKFVLLSDVPQRVSGGDALSICAVSKGGPMQVTLRDVATKSIVFDQTLDVQECERGSEKEADRGKAATVTAAPGDVADHVEATDDERGPGKGKDKRAD